MIGDIVRLVNEMKNLVLLKRRGENVDLSLIHQALPTEMLRNILQRLDIKNLCSARQTCKRWKDVIDGFELVEEACSKFMLTLYKTWLSLSLI